MCVVDRQILLGLVRSKLLGAIEIAQIISMRGCLCAIDVKQASANVLQKTHVVPFETLLDPDLLKPNKSPVIT